MGVGKLRILPKKTNIEEHVSVDLGEYSIFRQTHLEKTDTSLCFAWSYIFTHEINCNFLLANE
jgi:hypothetical protein